MPENKITKEEVKHIADLAKLTLSEQEVERFSGELSDTLSHINNLSELNFRLENLGETNQVSGLKNILREDEVDQRRILLQEEALSNGKSTHNGYFMVKRVIG